MSDKMYGFGFSLAQMMQAQQAMMEQFNLIMSSLGIELKLEKIDLEPKDEPNAIDFVWRLRCNNNEIAKILKEEFIKQFGGEQ